MDSNKILEQILKELVEVKVAQREMEKRFSELDQKFTGELKELNQKFNGLDQKFTGELKELNQKVDRLQLNQADIIKELSYGFSLAGKSRTSIERAQQDIKVIKSTLDYHNLGENKQKIIGERA